MRSVSVKLVKTVIIVALLVLFWSVFIVADHDLVFYAQSQLSGPADLIKKEKALVAATVKSYNRVLSDFYASGGMHAMLDNFPATRGVKHGVFRDLGYIKSAGRILVYDHAETTPVKITFTAPGKAEALVFEEWNFMYQRIQDRSPLSKPKGFGQGYRYALVHESGGWIVEGWDPVDMPEPDKKKEFLF